MTLLNRRILFSSAVAAAALPSMARTAARRNRPQGVSLDAIIARHTAARGGRAILDAVHSQAVDIQIVEKGSVIQGKYRCTKAPAYRIDIYDGGKHVFCEGLDAKGPWIWPSSNPSATQGAPDGARTALQGIAFNLYGLHAFPALGHTLALDGPRSSGVSTTT